MVMRSTRVKIYLPLVLSQIVVGKFIGGIPFKWDDRDLRDYFMKAGNVVNAEVGVSPPGQCDVGAPLLTLQHRVPCR